MGKIIYTLTDEAPRLATYSLLPVLQAYGRLAGVEVETRDISLAARILARFSDQLPGNKRFSDAPRDSAFPATRKNPPVPRSRGHATGTTRSQALP